MMLNESNVRELAQIAKEVGALVLRGQLRYPGPETGNWEIGPDVISEVLYQLRDHRVMMVLAAIDGEPVHLCGMCGFVLSKPGEPCPRCALLDQAVPSNPANSKWPGWGQCALLPKLGLDYLLLLTFLAVRQKLARNDAKYPTDEYRGRY